VLPERHGVEEKERSTWVENGRSDQKERRVEKFGSPPLEGLVFVCGDGSFALAEDNNLKFVAGLPVT
jgi:hypothetical protein